MLHYTNLERLARDKHLSLFGPFAIKNRNVVNMRPYTKSFVFFEAFDWTQKARVLDYTRQEILTMNKHSCFLGLLVSYKDNEVLWMWSQVAVAKLYNQCQNELFSLLSKGGNLAFFYEDFLIMKHSCFQAFFPFSIWAKLTQRLKLFLNWLFFPGKRTKKV